MTSKEACFGKLPTRSENEEISTLEPYLYLSMSRAVFCIRTVLASHVFLSLRLIVFTSVIRVFCVVLASSYLTLNFLLDVGQFFCLSLSLLQKLHKINMKIKV